MPQKKKGSRVQIHQVSKQFKENRVLTDVNVTIEPGEFIAIVGRSGCGKSTLLRLIAALDQPSKGSIYLESQAVGSTHEDTRVLFQEARLLPWKRVLDNVRIGATNKDKSSAGEALGLVGLAERSHDWPRVLSGGQKQRVALARALVSRPRLLLQDEPLGALDALTRIEMQQLIERLWLEQGFTVILVTHDVSEAVALADRVLLIEQGKIAFDTRITLARPRERDNGFVHFENLILNRVLNKEPADADPVLSRKLSYSI
ncbi:ATP-binding cassette domain-containing protein [Paenibacillus validus]|uniref:ATP-binding cassette domain-containing protein n=1 Tax=Paenibacillus validus TaxID=44253 RepID=UPI000FDCBDCD|nr:ATP-binding cassette domain-containing protein [Paenibacillus validus]MED4600875.1 ATP-binding cassette domain-containing protein [Paenibacillus validus]MED4606647.1 ATP-binding cassette domain-containing protein [Paenibacillus validus]